MVNFNTTNAVAAAQLISISTAFAAAGGIATLSAFDVREFQSQPSSRALPMTRWLFSRGSHIFPQSAVISSMGFAYLAYCTLPAGLWTEAFRNGLNNTRATGYLAASLLTFAIGPVTILFMAHPNFVLIEKNEKLGGSRSAASAEQSDPRSSQRSYVDSINGKGEANEFADQSGPQEKTSQDSSRGDDEAVRRLLQEFSWKNYVRAILMAAGGFVGLSTALAA